MPAQKTGSIDYYLAFSDYLCMQMLMTLHLPLLLKQNIPTPYFSAIG